MDTQRALLDQLMGKERNASFEEREKMQRHFWDDDVCKHFLVGLCPYELFKNTRSDLGEYDKLFDLRAKAEWDALDQKERDKYPYQWELLDLLKGLIEQCDLRIKRNRERCAEDERLKNEPKKLSEDEAKRLGVIQDEIGKLSKEAEELGENGEIEQAKVLSMRIEALKAESEQIMKKPDDPRFSGRQLMVCEVSGVLMSTTDSEARLKSLYSGKQYQGWKKVRDFYSFLKPLLDGKQRRGARGHTREKTAIATEMGTGIGIGIVIGKIDIGTEAGVVGVTADGIAAARGTGTETETEGGKGGVAIGLALDLGTATGGGEGTGPDQGIDRARLHISIQSMQKLHIAMD
eukprot:CAMPEP_0197514850 /NCGR_PEP_ID=MMETSP1318-20131121/163_1 /TAXON_ID=552666 /ORGANISM="Partenskyella glossopodia, Strain RCC365" /LENGTH=347 /DNA_ID=CAMNT_0043063057 /DNA_START=45 /DNA_END=1089 /DNA_ORIENTATION=+